MSEEENLDTEENLDEEKGEDLNEERAELEKLGVSSTFGLLSEPGKKKKEEEKRPAYRGFQ